MNRNSHDLRGSYTHVRNTVPRWRTVLISLVLALTIESAGQITPAQAAPPREPVYFSMKVQNPKTSLRCGETATYLVKVELQQTGAPTPAPGSLGLPKGLSVIGIKVEAFSKDLSVGDFVGAVKGTATARTAVVFDDYLSGLGAKFKFKANKPGKTTLYFQGLVGKEYISFNLDVKVLPCKFKATTIGEWHVPGPANISVVASSDDAEVKADDEGNFTGSTTVNWVVSSGQVGDCIPQSVTTSSQVDWTGNMDDNNLLMMDAKYQTAGITLPVYCVGSDGGIASGSTPVQLTPDPLQVSVAAGGGVFRQSQVLQGPEATPGYVTIIVVPEEDEAAAFNTDSRVTLFPSAWWAMLRDAFPWFYGVVLALR